MSSAPASAPAQPSSAYRGRRSAFSPTALFFAVLGAGGMAALWVLAALFLQRQSAWIAILAAADIALLLRIADTAPGRGRAVLCVIATAGAIVAANWGIAGTRAGLAFGYGTLDSLGSLGSDLAWTLAQLSNHGPELALYALALAIAWWLGR